MKRLLFLLIAILGLIYVYPSYKDEINLKYNDLVYFSFCEKPIMYKVGSVDPKFQVSEEKVKEDIEKAASIWNKYLDKELFLPSESAQLTINLIYDERQRALTRVSTLESQVVEKKDDIDAQVEVYKKKLSQLENKSKVLAGKIDYWNSRGGAPKDVYNELINEQNILNQQIEELNTTVQEINNESMSVNEKIDILNNYVDQFNNLVETHPEEGIYDPQKNLIEIYFYDSENRFIHTVAHELGHSLGLEHVLDNRAILNPITSENIILTEDDKEAIDKFCIKQNKIEYVFKNFDRILNIFSLPSFNN